MRREAEHYATGRHMADTKALFTQRFDAARSAWSEGDEPMAAECLRAAIIAARGDPRLRPELASALFNLGKLSRKFGPAGEAEAGPLLAEALGISEELFGRQGAALAPVLHELSRLQLQQSQHARAKDTLERLLAIARIKGEEHPEVAAALFDLAFVRRKLGDDASAEALYRDALRIREKVLGPNHTVTVATVERLSETCAARGNFAEALALLQRALPMREAALGADHERVRAARARVAELESQMARAANTAAAAVRAAGSAELTPAWPRRMSDAFADTPSSNPPSAIDSKELDFLGGSEPRVLRSIPDAAPIQADSPEPARKKRALLYSSAGAATVAVAIAGLLMLRPSAGSARNPVSVEKNAWQHTADAPIVTGPPTRTVSNRTGPAPIVAATYAESLRTASATSAPAAAALQREQRASGKTSPELRAPRVEVHLDSTNLPSMPAAQSVDAIVRSTMDRQRASDTDRTEPRIEVSRPASPDVESAHTSPKIIGRAPAPAFPDALLRSGRREGKVVVRFMVNELGKVDVASIIVEQSDHDLFTDAVREVLTRFRFEPAYTLGPVSKPVAAWVSVPFRFTTKK